MEMSAKIIGMLNEDTKARALLETFNAKAREKGLSNDEYAKAREVVLLMAMYQNKEVMAEMANEIWEAVNN